MQLNRINKGIWGAYLTSLYTTSHDLVFQGILEDVIAGTQTGIIDNFVKNLDNLVDGDEYKELLFTEDPLLFNAYLSSAITDIIFSEIPAIPI
jgi:hypothetical protein